jgi:hypothetical protein
VVGFGEEEMHEGWWIETIIVTIAGDGVTIAPREN